MAYIFRNPKSASESLTLLELDVGVPVPSFDIEGDPVNLRDVGEVSEGPLVRIFGIELLCWDELVVVVEDMCFFRKDLARFQQSFQKHLAKAFVDVGLVFCASPRHELLVVGLRSLDHPEDGVGAAEPVTL